MSSGTLQEAPHSEHYKKHAIEPLQVIEDYHLGFHAGNALKYLLRYHEKDGLRDLQKAKWYIERLLATDGNDTIVESAMPLTDFDELQQEIIAWQVRNFGINTNNFMGMVEELGELAHALLKKQQGIRGTAEEHEAAARDALGDIFVYAFGFCAQRGWNLTDVVNETWSRVKLRDWTKNKLDGGDKSPQGFD